MGGYYKYYGEILSVIERYLVLMRVIISTVESIQYSGISSINSTEDIPSPYSWYASTYWWYSSAVLMISLHCAEYPSQYWRYPHIVLIICLYDVLIVSFCLTEYSLTLLHNLHCTAHTLSKSISSSVFICLGEPERHKKFQSKHLESLLQCSETNEIADNLLLSWLSIWSFINPTVF